MSALVIDASVALAWAFEEDLTPALRFERLRHEPKTAPILWWYELRNVLVTGERRGRLTEIQTTRFLHELALVPIVLDRSPDEPTVLGLARRHKLTVYDAAYLELALRAGAPLATLDAALARAARAEGVPLLGE